MTVFNPDGRPVKRRSAARVLVIANDEVLLTVDTDPGIPGSMWWALPGGGLEDGEDPRDAAVRELAEETGLHFPDLIGPIAERLVTYGFSDRILVQREWFYRAEVEKFVPDSTGLTAEERVRQISFGWVAVADLACLNTRPGDLGILLNATPSDPVDMGTVEESTIPVLPVAATKCTDQPDEDKERAEEGNHR